MNPRPLTLALGVFLVAVSGATAADPVANGEAESVTVEAFTPFTADIRMIQSGEDKATFVGSMSGTFYLDAGRGPLASGDLACVGMFDISLSDGSQKGSGSCTFSAGDGALAFANWSCEGYHLVGCQGPFSIMGGTGRLAGLTGEGPATIRSDFHAVAETAGGEVVQQTEGILFWKELQLSMPPALAPSP
jgi:hypothetical protein